MTAHPPAVGAYRLLGPLGRGGMGMVYRALHTPSGRAAAVKMVRLPDHRLVASIRREIQGLARLAHPGIVRILDEGVEDGLPWYAMELVEGAVERSRIELSTAAQTIVPRRNR